MSKKRRDSRNRILHNGEMQLADGRYRFKYLDHTGQVRYVYSWRPDKNDRTPDGRKNDIPLREKERKIQADLFDQIVSNGGNYTVLELVERYISTKTGVRDSTRAGYKTVTNFLEKDPMGSRRIDKVKLVLHLILHLFCTFPCHEVPPDATKRSEELAGKWLILGLF